MSTLDNLNENILQKIDIIDKLISICVDELKLPIQENLLSCNNINENYYNTNIPLSFNQNLKILNKRYSIFIDKKYTYEIQSILFLTEYYALDHINKTYKISNNIYNDNIFLLSTNSSVLTNGDLLLLKNIFYNNYYKYKYFQSASTQKQTYNKLINSKLSKKIYHNFNIFISIITMTVTSLPPSAGSCPHCRGPTLSLGRDSPSISLGILIPH